MEYQTLIRSRFSVRAYENRSVPDQSMQKVLQAFCLAPTAANRQPLGLVVVETASHQEALQKVYRPAWFWKQPPLVLCACTTPEQAWTRGDGKCYADVDVAIAMDHLILAATDEGLGTCWIGAFDIVAAREALGLPDDVEPVAWTPLGYPADASRPKLRKPLEQLVHYGQW